MAANSRCEVRTCLKKGSLSAYRFNTVFAAFKYFPKKSLGVSCTSTLCFSRNVFTAAAFLYTL
jgi:hypothetical protein